MRQRMMAIAMVRQSLFKMIAENRVVNVIYWPQRHRRDLSEIRSLQIAFFSRWRPSPTQHNFLDPPPDGSEDYLGSLGHYRVLSELGKGGMGYVFLAEDTRLKRQVALKVMNQKIASTPGSKKRFISEARAMAAVHHDNVATIFEVGERNGTPFMAMELLEGSTLENYRERFGEPDFHTVIEYARDIARGLAAAHGQGIVHRDIKPANIWLDTKTNRIKILDFGLALAQTPVDQLSGRGAVVGTPGYLSPEQARSEPLDDRSDLYSTGVVLYELATGALPLKTKAVAEQLIAILAHAPKPLRERNEQIPQPLADLIHKLMAKEPRDRFRNAAELEKVLDEVEVECEKKTEVAQAINQLQLGLEKAVKNKESGAADLGLVGENQAMPNPFESLPDAFDSLPAATPMAPGVASSGVHAAVPVSAGAAGGPLAAGQASAAGKKAAATSAPASNSKVIYIAVGICAAVLLVAIPLIVFLSDSSAIARQQEQEARVINSDVSPPPSGAANSSNASAANQNKPQQPKPKPQTKPANQRAGSQNPGASPSAASTLITKVDAKAVQGVAAKGAKWLISTKQANGSFEEGDHKAASLKIPGWTATKIGSDAGWSQRPNVRNPDAKTFAYAGRKSELRLVSDPASYQTKSGDSFRVSMNLGGEGNGQTLYRVVLGFKGNKGTPVRYLLTERSDQSKWAGGQQTKLHYEYAVDDSVAGKRPFLELTISNKNNNRKRAMLDRVVMTVKPKQGRGQASAAGSDLASAAKSQSKPSGPGSSSPQTPPMKTSPPNNNTPNNNTPTNKPPANTTPNPSSTAGNKTPAGNSGASNSATPNVVRDITLTTADEGGADTTVKRGGSINDPLGEKPMLSIQTRRDRQIQHIYLRFPLTSLRGGNQQNNNRNRQGGNQKKAALPVVASELRLSLSGKRPAPASIRVYGLGDSVSDMWPENRIAWSNSLSAKGLQGLPMLAEVKVSPGDSVLSVSNPLLTSFIADASGRSVTFILTGSTGDEMVNFVAKESGGKPAPTLVLGLSE